MRRSTALTVGTLALSAIVLTGCSGGSGSPDTAATLDPTQDVTLTFTWWGNENRAQRYEQVIDLFEAEHPNITVNGSFGDFPSYWEKRQVEAAGGGLPDVMQFDWSYLRQYGENQLLLDLTPYFGDIIDADSIDADILSGGKLGDATLAIPTGIGVWSLYQNVDKLTELGIDPYEGGGSWEDYDAWMADATTKSGGTVFGGSDYTQRIQNFELELRAEGRELFTEDGVLNFTEDELAAYWERGVALADDGTVVPQQTLEELSPVSGFGAARTVSELSWSTFLAGYIADSGATEVSMVAPPTAKEGVADLYPKIGLMQAVAANSDHPAEAALFVDFLINSPEVAEIFGTTLGITGSSTAAAGLTLEGPDLQVSEYLDSIQDRLGAPPAPPVVGFGSIEQTFLDLGKEIGLGTLTPADAATRFFQEVDSLIG